MARRALAIPLLVLLLSPAAVATAYAPVGGEVRFPSGALLEGAARVEAGKAALDLSPALRAGAPVLLSWSAARGHLVTWEWTVAGDGDGPSYGGGARRDPVELAAGQLVEARCAGACQMLLLGGAASRLGVEGPVAGPLRWLGAPQAYWAAWNDGGANAFLHQVPAGAILAGGAGTPMEDARAWGAGPLTLFLENVVLLARTPGGEPLRLDTTTRRDALADLPGLARLDRVESRFALLELEDAALSTPPGAGARLMAAEPVVLLDGSLRALRASGRLEHAGQTVLFHDAPLALEGRLVLTPRPEPGGEGLRSGVAGEARHVQAGAFRSEPASGLGAAGAAGVALLVALGWWLPRLALPLYSRVARSSVLQSPNRRRLHALIAAEPGRTPAELARRLGIARVVARHHLRMLEAHRYVVCRRDGRKRRYFPPEAQTGEVPPDVLLGEGPRRRVVEALAAAPLPLTQTEISARTGCSPRLVSYHLARLSGLGLVRRTGARPFGYVLEAAAARALARGRGA